VTDSVLNKNSVWSNI